LVLVGEHDILANLKAMIFANLRQVNRLGFAIFAFGRVQV
jgi:hypothetical protein